MTSIAATATRKYPYNLDGRANEDCKPTSITNSKGKGAILTEEDDWSTIEETPRIASMPSMVQKLTEARNESLSECVGIDELDWQTATRTKLIELILDTGKISSPNEV